METVQYTFVGSFRGVGSIFEKLVLNYQMNMKIVSIPQNESQTANGSTYSNGTKND